MKIKISALIIGLVMFASTARAATISILYTGVVSSASLFNNIPVANIGDPVRVSYSFNTDLASPGNYINTGTSSSLFGTGNPALGSAIFQTPGPVFGNNPIAIDPCPFCGGIGGGASDIAVLGTTYSQSVSSVFAPFQASQVTSQLFPNSAIPGDITAAFVLEGIGIGTGGFGFRAGSFTASVGYRIDSVTVQSIPLPAALPVFAAGLGIVGLFGRRRKRRTQRRGDSQAVGRLALCCTHKKAPP